MVVFYSLETARDSIDIFAKRGINTTSTLVFSARGLEGRAPETCLQEREPTMTKPIVLEVFSDYV